MSFTHADAIIGLCISVATLCGIALTWLRWVRPRVRKARRTLTAAADALIGREAVVDSITGEELAPALPGIGVRMASVEGGLVAQNQQMATLTEAVAKIAESHQRLDDHETRIGALESATVERVVTRAESIQHMRTTEAALYAHPPTLPQEDSDG